MPASYQTHRAQLEALLTAWGMPSAFAERTAEVMAWADLHGIDSHGISMIPAYYERQRSGRLKMSAQPRVLQQTPVSALIDADGGLGHEPSRQAMEIAIEKAGAIGIGVVAVRNSAHFGACGFYAKMAADAGMIGMAATSASAIQVAPTGGAQARLGTDPWSFAAPGRDGEPFLLDMATTTVAAGRIRNKANEGLPTPPGWLLTKEGLPSTDPLEAVQKGGFLTSLGGSPEGSSYKGYGLSMMVNILGSCLSGATLITDPLHTKKPQGFDIGHFFLAMRPTLFRAQGEFEADVASLCDALRATRPVDPAQPVMVAGDKERQNAARRLRTGIPVGANLLATIERIAAESGVPWLLGTADAAE
ncbi:MAG: Ldh family oxidoreductase [Acetobacteraceae bacterium]